MNNLPRDIHQHISGFLNDRDIINYCEVNNCNDDFYFHVLLQRYPETLKFKDTSNYRVTLKPKTYKQYYLEIVRAVAILEETYGINYKKYNRQSNSDPNHPEKDNPIEILKSYRNMI